jgi:hypothetical protein
MCNCACVREGLVTLYALQSNMESQQKPAQSLQGVGHEMNIGFEGL